MNVNSTTHSGVFNGSTFQREFKGVAKGACIVCCLGFVLEQTNDYVYLELAHVERFIVTKRI